MKEALVVDHGHASVVFKDQIRLLAGVVKELKGVEQWAVEGQKVLPRPGEATANVNFQDIVPAGFDPIANPRKVRVEGRESSGDQIGIDEMAAARIAGEKPRRKCRLPGPISPR